jgi:hypothetical protein
MLHVIAEAGEMRIPINLLQSSHCSEVRSIQRLDFRALLLCKNVWTMYGALYMYGAL